MMTPQINANCLGVLCPSCDWQGLASEANCAQDEYVLCPQCGVKVALIVLIGEITPDGIVSAKV